MHSSESKIHSTVPVICSDDIKKSLSYYINTLGFEPDFEFGDPLSYAGVKCGDVEIYFTYDPDFATVIKEKELHPEVFLWLEDAESFYKAHLKNGAHIVETIADRPWGARQYVVRDINGYHLKFAQPI